MIWDWIFFLSDPVLTSLKTKDKYRIIWELKMFSKSIETKAVFTKTEMNNDENISFLQNSLHGI